MDPDETFEAALPGGTTAPAPLIEATLPPPDKALGRALVIFPGGGYAGLAPHEGAGYAEYFSQRGYACFVVRYRLGSEGFRHPAMLEDAAAAVHSVRSRAGQFGIDPRRIGVMGSSAGGHLAATLMVYFDKYASQADCRPDFGILCYPVINFTGTFGHIGSCDNLLGKGASGPLKAALSCEKQVKAASPPCFLWHTAEDTVVPMENSFVYASALKAAGIPCEVHVFPKGRHGLGLETPYGWDSLALRVIDDCFAS